MHLLIGIQQILYLVLHTECPPRNTANEKIQKMRIHEDSHTEVSIVDKILQQAQSPIGNYAKYSIRDIKGEVSTNFSRHYETSAADYIKRKHF